MAYAVDFVDVLVCVWDDQLSCVTVEFASTPILPCCLCQQLANCFVLCGNDDFWSRIDLCGQTYLQFSRTIPIQVVFMSVIAIPGDVVHCQFPSLSAIQRTNVYHNHWPVLTAIVFVYLLDWAAFYHATALTKSQRHLQSLNSLVFVCPRLDNNPRMHSSLACCSMHIGQENRLCF
jgi:hypothetical protein